MKKFILIIIFTVIASTIFESKSQSFYTIIDDDASSVESITNIKNVCDDEGVKISFAVITQNLIKNEIIKDSLLSFQQQGFHICNHSLTHSSKVWEDIDYAAIKEELHSSNYILDSLGFVNHNYFVYPYGKFSKGVYSNISPLISDKFKMAFNSRGDECNLKDFNRYYINRFPLRKHENISIVKNKIDRAIENGSWIVFLTHSANKRDFSQKYLSEVIDYCNKKGLQCLTVDEAYGRVSDFEYNDNTYEWEKSDELYSLIEMHIWYILLFVILVFLIIGLLYIFKIKCK